MKKQNPWISLFRVILCIVVIQIHFPLNETSLLGRWSALASPYAVPCFMFLSFYFMTDDVMGLNRDRIKERLLRLYIPILFWNTVYFLVLNLFGAGISVKKLIMSFMLAHGEGLCVPLWFLMAQLLDLIFIVIVFQYLPDEKARIFASVFILILTFVLLKAGIITELFETASYELKYPLQRTVQCVPYAVLGLLSSCCLKDKKVRIKVITVVAFVLVGFISFKLSLGEVATSMVVAALCEIVLMVPDDVIKGRLRILLNYLGACTMGIYCVHLLLGMRLNGAFSGRLHSGNMTFILSIFLLGLLISIIIRLINRKLNWKFLTYIA